MIIEYKHIYHRVVEFSGPIGQNLFTSLTCGVDRLLNKYKH